MSGKNCIVNTGLDMRGYKYARPLPVNLCAWTALSTATQRHGEAQGGEETVVRRSETQVLGLALCRGSGNFRRNFDMVGISKS